METQKKIMTRVQLINWHYFENERISFHGSTLISGENTAGKSTILDAIQLVLTTNTRRFNVAANEKGKRDLRGYVRCKIGNVGEAYLRKGAVPANVALEFYEEKGDRYFVLGVHMLSRDEESPVTTRWYIEECRLEDLSFMAGERAALAEEFRAKNRKISYIDQKNAAQDRFKRRLGNLDDKFFDIIPKSLAFKPMDNVKEFINKFVLSEAQVDVVSLRENIETLSELENILDRSRRQQGALEKILGKYDEIEEKDRSILVNDILLKIANRDAMHLDVENLEKKIRIKSQSVESNRGFLEEMGKQIKDLENQVLAISIDIEATHSNALLQQARSRIEKLEEEIGQKKEGEKKLQEQVRLLMNYLRDLERLDYKPVKRTQAEQIGKAADREEKAKTVERLEAFDAKEQNEIQKTCVILTADMDRLSDEINDCQERLKKLEKRGIERKEIEKIHMQVKEKDSLLCIKEYKNGNYIFDSPELEAYLNARTELITDMVKALAGYFRTKGMKVGLDLFAPFLSLFVGQDYAALSKSVDFIKPMLYRCTYTPAGMEYELEGMAGEMAGRMKQIIGMEDGRLTDFMEKELETARKLSSCKIYAGMEIHTVKELPFVSAQSIRDGVERAERSGCEGRVASWNILEASKENLLAFMEGEGR